MTPIQPTIRETPLAIEVHDRLLAERLCRIVNNEDSSNPYRLFADIRLTFRYIDHRDTEYTYRLVVESTRKPRHQTLGDLRMFLAGALAMSKCY